MMHNSRNYADTSLHSLHFFFISYTSSYCHCLCVFCIFVNYYIFSNYFVYLLGTFKILPYAQIYLTRYLYNYNSPLSLLLSFFPSFFRCHSIFSMFQIPHWITGYRSLLMAFFFIGESNQSFI